MAGVSGWGGDTRGAGARPHGPRRCHSPDLVQSQPAPVYRLPCSSSGQSPPPGGVGCPSGVGAEGWEPPARCDKTTVGLRESPRPGPIQPQGLVSPPAPPQPPARGLARSCHATAWCQVAWRRERASPQSSGAHAGCCEGARPGAAGVGVLLGPHLRWDGTGNALYWISLGAGKGATCLGLFWAGQHPDGTAPVGRRRDPACPATSQLLLV